jgi:hypothetical protein
MAFDIARTPADAWDARFMGEATTLRTCTIDAGAIGSTNFHASREQRAQLIHRGRLAARKFLREFDLARYRNSYGRRMTGIASDSPA